MTTTGAWLYTLAVAGFGAGVAVAICAWTQTKREARMWDHAWHAGRAAHIAEMDVLAERHPGIGLGDALTLAAVGRLLDKENQ